jgi:P4 family phage/plasmid primase-like protien
MIMPDASSLGKAESQDNAQTGNGEASKAWHRRAPDLTPWMADRLVVNWERHGGYKADGSQNTPGKLTERILTQHCRATEREHVRGVHSTIIVDGQSMSKWAACDIDAHDGDGADPGHNFAYGCELVKRCRDLGLHPILEDSDGKGGLHFWVFFSRIVPTAKVFAFLAWLTSDAAKWGVKVLEKFPKQPNIKGRGKEVGNWLRLPGRHHKRDHWSKVWDDVTGEWREGDEAIDALLACTGDDPDLIPAEAIAPPEVEQPKQEALPKSNGQPVTLDDVALAADALRFLPASDCDSYKPWLETGMSLFKLGRTGLDLWIDWSRGSNRFQAGVCEAKWETFTEDGVKLGTLFHRATAAGWIRPRPAFQANGKASASPSAATVPGPAPSNNGHSTGEPVVATQEDPINRTDLGNARRLVKRYGKNIRYCPKWGSWLCWDGKRWREDETGAIYRLAKRTVRSIGAEAAKADDDNEVKALLKWALISEDKKRIVDMIALAWSEPGIPVETGQLNANPWLLNCQNGTVDLKTGELLPHRQEDLITKLAPVVYDLAAECPKWNAFLHRIMDGNADLVRFLQRAAGYALTGDVSEHAMLFFYGTGRNGKGTFLEAFLAILGDYATTVDASLLAAKRNDDHPTGLTDLDGCRFVATQEVEDGRRMAEALVKKLTGGDRIKARRMRENFYEFDPVHKLFLAANHKPEIRGTDEGIWSRIMLVPFTVFIPPAERIRNLKNLLVKEEGPGILAWAVRGCLEWQERGLNPPATVADATREYRSAQDVLAGFLAEHCVVNPAHKVKATPLYARYKAWAELAGEFVMPQRKFGVAMTERGFTRDKDSVIVYRGLDLRHDIDGWKTTES